MSFNFPNVPVVDEEYSSGGKTYIWDGGAWMLKSSSVSGVRPIVTAIDPVVAGNGDPDFVMSIIGSNFEDTSEVFFDNDIVPSTFVSDTELTIDVSPATLGTGAYFITVNNGGLTSIPAIRFDVIYHPQVTGVTPPAGIAGGPTHSLFVIGGQFSANPSFPAVILLDGVEQVTDVSGAPTELSCSFTPPAAAATIKVNMRNGPVLASTPDVDFIVS